VSPVPAPMQLVPAVRQAIQDGFGATVLVGSEPVNGQAADHYRLPFRYRDTEFGIEGTSDVWIDAANVLPVQVQFQGSYQGQDCKVIATFSYGPGIKIEPPI
jgi:hypothetical protein